VTRVYFLLPLETQFRSLLQTGNTRDNRGSPDWIKSKNPNAPAMKREAEIDWSR
jgi:hypothetical protein